MKPIRVLTPETEEHLEQYVKFLNRYRKELYPWADFRDFTGLVCHHFLRGNIGIGLDENDSIMGAFVFCIGTPEQQYRNRDAAFVNIALLREDYRNTFSYLVGMTEVAMRIDRSGPDVRDVYFIAHRDSSYLHRLYAKFAEKHDLELDGNYQSYRVSLRNMLDYVRRFENRARR